MSSFTRNIFKAGVVLGAFCFAGVAQAATADGALAATSIGTTDVTVTIADRVQVSNLDTIVLGTYLGSGTLVGTDDMCIYRSSTGAYDIQLDSANAGAASEFRLAAGLNFIVYQLQFDDDSDAAVGGTIVLDGDSVTNQAGHASDTTCGAVDNAEIRVFITEANLQAAVAGSYTDTVTLTVTPF